MADHNEPAWSVAWEPEKKVLSVRADGVRHHFHTDPEEGAAFARRVRAFSAGSYELAQLLGYKPATAEPDTLKRRWLEKVTAAGADPDDARGFLVGRLAAAGEVA